MKRSLPPNADGLRSAIARLTPSALLDVLTSATRARGSTANPNTLFQTRGSEIDVYGIDERRSPSLTLLYRINGDDPPLSPGAGYSLKGSPVADPSGRFLFGSGHAGIWGYAIDVKTGALRYLGILAPGTFDRPLVVSRPTSG